MYNINTKYWKKKSLNQYILNEDGTLTSLALIILGIIAAVFHQVIRLKGVNIPGHHGLEWMTLLLFGRMQSRYRWAGILVATGAASSYMLQSAYMPLTESFKPAVVYLINGFCVDFLYRYSPKNLPAFIKGILFGGVSFMIKPILLIPFAMFLEFHFGSFDKHGYIFPVLTHFMFGSIGAICGITLANLMKDKH